MGHTSTRRTHRAQPTCLPFGVPVKPFTWLLGACRHQVPVQLCNERKRCYGRWWQRPMRGGKRTGLHNWQAHPTSAGATLSCACAAPCAAGARRRPLQAGAPALAGPKCSRQPPGLCASLHQAHAQYLRPLSASILTSAVPGKGYAEQ